MQPSHLGTKPVEYEVTPIYTWRNYEFTRMVCKFTVIMSLITVQLHGLNRNPHIADSLLREAEKKGSIHCNIDTERDGKVGGRPVHILRHTRIPWLGYLGNEEHCWSVGHCLLLNFQKTIKSMCPVEPVSKKKRHFALGHLALSVSSLKIPPIQF